MATAPTVDALVQALHDASRPLDAAGQRLAVALYRTLAEGGPVAAVELAGRTGRSVEEVTATLDGWPNVFYDQHRQVIGFWGLALPEMAIASRSPVGCCTPGAPLIRCSWCRCLASRPGWRPPAR